MNTFAKNYEPFFRTVFHLIDKNWKIDQRDIASHNTHRIKLINPDYRHLVILVSLENQRFNVSIHADRRISPYVESHSCSLSPSRSAVSIAREIERKITIHAEQMMKLASEHYQHHLDQKESEQILKHCLSRLFPIQNAFNSLLGFRAKNISGSIKSPFSGNYTLKLENLTQDQLIKVSGFVSGMED
ncbi:TPA: hypothetical protein MG739_25065 [Klebsiella pneumoniae]|uniref:Uncharacterized protein n=1 Tax=Klebsiella pneumoniae TaxID=573 RepID=A0A3G4RJ86_KLEPN|nr:MULTISPECIES: hypothetical protein [Klebsiella]AYU65729.1 hypothetical protein [Klebsiella pneumoniae]MBC4425497.1 hypothetical protein [Klebsiella variicola]MBK2797271.1 hypothetical protein [Klebsiella pneumoniae]MCC4959741.1 hypothetical protein [Klebsiella pneumoniae]MCD7091701.1 hypothetical protein [Klebsiella quasipneumoniae subsp. quasipneumoniae]